MVWGQVGHTRNMATKQGVSTHIRTGYRRRRHTRSHPEVEHRLLALVAARFAAAPAAVVRRSLDVSQRRNLCRVFRDAAFVLRGYRCQSRLGSRSTRRRQSDIV